METTTPKTEFNPSQGRFNRSALKNHFLKVSETTRGGKLSRVSKGALDELEARAEAKMRELLNLNITSPVGGSVKPTEGVNFLTGKGKARLVEAFQNFIASEAQRIVNDVRVGKTI